MKKVSKIHTIEIEDLRKVILDSKSYSDVLRSLNLSYSGGRTRDVLKQKIKDNSISISHFKPYSQKKSHKRGRDYKEILIENSDYRNLSCLKSRLIKDRLLKYECLFCKNNGFHNGLKLSLQMNHINGNRLDNRIENLRILCPNCHSQTETYGSKNVKNKGD